MPIDAPESIAGGREFSSPSEERFSRAARMDPRFHSIDDEGTLPRSVAIRVEGLTVGYDSTPVLRDVDFELSSLKMTGIIGPNGAGKSTLLKAILRLVPMASGTVRFGPVAMTEDDHGAGPCCDVRPRRTLTHRACHWLGCHTGACIASPIAYVPQRSTVDWDFPTTVFDTVLMGTYGRLRWFQRPGRSERAAAWEAIEQVNLQDLAGRPIGELSGGQQQRTFLARALAQGASVYLLDEPFAGVDVTTEAALIEILHQMRNAGKTIAMVHHDLSTAAHYFDDVVMLNRGITASGSVADTLTDANIALTYQSTARGGLAAPVGG